MKTPLYDIFLDKIKALQIHLKPEQVILDVVGAESAKIKNELEEYLFISVIKDDKDQINDARRKITYLENLPETIKNGLLE